MKTMLKNAAPSVAITLLVLFVLTKFAPSYRAKF